MRRNYFKMIRPGDVLTEKNDSGASMALEVLISDDKERFTIVWFSLWGTHLSFGRLEIVTYPSDFCSHELKIWKCDE